MKTPAKPTRRAALAAALGASAAVALPARAAVGGTPPPVLVGEQAARKLLLLDPRKQTWDPVADPSCVLWEFSPEDDPRYAELKPEISWTYVNEGKVRRHWGRTYVLSTASFGFAAVVEYPTGRRYWGTTLAAGTDTINPHSIELLPNGNVAVASSTGGIVRVYAASQGPANSTYAEAALRSAHGVQWDGRRGVLWAIGHEELVAYRVGGLARPTLSQVFSIALPDPAGHDMGQVAATYDRLWVTTAAEVFQFSKSRKVFLQDFPWTPGASRAKVKAVCDDPSTGRIAGTRPEPGLGETWWTEHVLTHPSGRAYRLVGGGIYKARWWRP